MERNIVNALSYKFINQVTLTSHYLQVDENSLYDCPAPGYYPFEGDCNRFYKCLETDDGKLKGKFHCCYILIAHI